MAQLDDQVPPDGPIASTRQYGIYMRDSEQDDGLTGNKLVGMASDFSARALRHVR